jgi:hypothetical protein
MKERTVRAMLNAPPQPVSISTSSGSSAWHPRCGGIGEHIFHRADAEIRHAQRIGSDTAAGQIKRFVAVRLAIVPA